MLCLTNTESCKSLYFTAGGMNLCLFVAQEDVSKEEGRQIKARSFSLPGRLLGNPCLLRTS